MKRLDKVNDLVQALAISAIKMQPAILDWESGLEFSSNLLEFGKKSPFTSCEIRRIGL